MTQESRESAKAGSPSLPRAFRFWLKLGFINFGGPSGQIATMQNELVERKRWIGPQRFLHALNYCMLLPGPEAQQLAIYIGWLLNGAAGGVIAGVLFVLPASVLLAGLAWAYAAHGTISWIASVFFGLRAAVIAIVILAVIKIGRSAFRSVVHVVIAGVAFVALFFFHVPFPILIGGAALTGLLGSRIAPRLFSAPSSSTAARSAVLDDSDRDTGRRRSLAATGLTLLACAAAWWGPVIAVVLIRGRSDVLSGEAIFFSKAAVVTFGGAYAVLSYVAQQVVQKYHWVTPSQMLDGLGLAETTPGPLILVTEFIGFLSAYRSPGNLSPLTAGLLGAAVTVWATFAPCFLWVLVGAPYIERLRDQRWLNGALSAVTAAVVGVILNLAVWLALHTLFPEIGEKRLGPAVFPAPHWASIQWLSLGIAAAALLGQARLKWRIEWVVGASALLGLVLHPLIGR
jgi:chromate transporter